jgi:hypothetical protein
MPAETPQEVSEVVDATAAERWDLITEATDEAQLPAVDRYHIERITRELRPRFSKCALLVVEQKRGPGWVMTGQGIGMPRDGRGVTPEGGARMIVKLARDFSELHNHARLLRVTALGESKSGASGKALFSMQVDFADRDLDEDGDDIGSPLPDAPDARARAARVIEENAVMESMRVTMADTFRHFDRAMERCGMMADRVVKLAEMASEGQNAMVEAIRMDYQDKREERQHQEDMRNQVRVDKIFEKVVDVGGGIFDDFLRQRVGMSREDMSGLMSSQLAALLARIPEEKRSAVSDIIGADAWQTMLDMAGKDLPDDAFRALTSKLAEQFGDAQQQMRIFTQIAATVDNEAVVIAIARLLQSASD